MYNFILHLSFMVSLALMVYLFARAIPRVGDDVSGSRTHRIDKFLRAIPLEKIDYVIGMFLEKGLRKVKLGIMRLDNVVSFSLDKVRKFSNVKGKKNGEEQPTLFGENGGEKKKKA